MIKVPRPFKGKRFTDAQWEKIGGLIHPIVSPVAERSYAFRLSEDHSISWVGKPPLFSQFVAALNEEESVTYRKLRHTERVQKRFTKKIEKTYQTFVKVLFLAIEVTQPPPQ